MALGLPFLAATAVISLSVACLANPISDPQPLAASQTYQRPLDDVSEYSGRPLTGRFLHITDVHPDPFYKPHTSPDDSSCHRGHGTAGVLGAETTDCDSPYSLVHATFDWIAANLKDSVDFVVWTGDSARHDNDDQIPRNDSQVLDQNQDLVDRMIETFGGDEERETIPIVPTFGNNDMLPHNILSDGPNKWTRKYANMWKRFIPEEQAHQFERGGWFYVEVIPGKLAVFSLNTIYFFEKNAAVDGCASPEEPGYEHMRWLRIQLQFMRERGMKAILSGHVGPARTEDKTGWDETCWQKYALWMRQYRDVVITGIYGHMNIDHFFMQDFKDIDWNVAASLEAPRRVAHSIDEDDGSSVSISSTDDYLMSLRDQWSKLPSVPTEVEPDMKKKKSKEQKFYDDIGGEWGERFSVSYTSASVVPNYFPTLRVFEYNITGLEGKSFSTQNLATKAISPPYLDEDVYPTTENALELDPAEFDNCDLDTPDETAFASLVKHHKKKKPKKPKFTVPLPPSKSSPPGPAYSPQTFSLLGYTQYFANLTRINNDTDPIITKNKGRKGDDKDPKPRPFSYEVEYDTRESHDAFRLEQGLFVRDMVKLASRIGRSKGGKLNVFDQSGPDAELETVQTIPSVADLDEAQGLETADDADSDDDDGNDEAEADKHKKKKKKHHKKKKRRRIADKAWLAFVQRALVGTVDAEELSDRFGQPEDDSARF